MHRACGKQGVILPGPGLLLKHVSRHCSGRATISSATPSKRLHPFLCACKSCGVYNACRVQQSMLCFSRHVPRHPFHLAQSSKKIAVCSAQHPVVIAKTLQNLHNQSAAGQHYLTLMSHQLEQRKAEHKMCCMHLQGSQLQLDMHDATEPNVLEQQHLPDTEILSESCRGCLQVYLLAICHSPSYISIGWCYHCCCFLPCSSVHVFCLQ